MYQFWKRHAFLFFFFSCKVFLLKRFLSVSSSSNCDALIKHLSLILYTITTIRFLCFSAKRYQIILCNGWVEPLVKSSWTSATCINPPQSSQSTLPLSMSGFCFRLSLRLGKVSHWIFVPFFQKMRGGGGGIVSLYKVTTATTWTNTHNEEHTDGKWRKRETEIKREDGGWMNTGPSAESGEDDVPVCPLWRWRRSWQEAGWQALPGGSGTEYLLDTPPRHQALLPGS